MFSAAWKMLKDTVLAFINDEALSRGAAIAFYTVTSIAPVLLIVIAIAGLAFGQDAAQNALTAQLSGLMGPANCRGLTNCGGECLQQIIRCHGDDDWNYHLDGDGFGRLRRNADGVKCDLEG
jgi:hypothetical protein